MAFMSIPVLYYHRVNRTDRRMAVTPEVFSDQMETLARKGWRAIGATELLEFLKGEEIGLRKAFLITFDDGYFDNWFYAYPILARTEMKALIFLVSDWVRDAGPARPNSSAESEPPPVRDLDHAIKGALKNNFADFLSTAEIQAMARSGRIEFGSHGSNHSPCFASHRVRGFLYSSSVHWTKTILAQGNPRPGTPIYDWASALTVPRFYPHPEFKERMVSQVSHQLEKMSKQDGQRMERLESLFGYWAKKIQANEPEGDYESPAAAEVRIKAELESSRRKIETLTDLPCPALCWPWGQHSRLGVRAAKNAGYQLAFTTRTGAVCRGDDSFRLDRLRVSGRTSGRQLALMMSALAHPAAARLARRFSASHATDHFLEHRLNFKITGAGQSSETPAVTEGKK